MINQEPATELDAKRNTKFMATVNAINEAEAELNKMFTAKIGFHEELSEALMDANSQAVQALGDCFIAVAQAKQAEAELESSLTAGEQHG